MQTRRTQLQQHPDFRITSSTILASTLHITRVSARNPNPTNPDATAGSGSRPGAELATSTNSTAEAVVQQRSDNPGNPTHPGQSETRQQDNGPNPGAMNSFSSLLFWILGGASSEGLNSFLSLFRDVRDHGQDFAESNRNENRPAQDVQQQQS